MGIRDRLAVVPLWIVASACLGWLSAPSHSGAAPRSQTVAVLPFRDLSGERGFIGEAIRETVTVDLKQLGSLRVVERASIDRVLREQGFQASAEVDIRTATRVGKVLGATLMVLGAYQKLASQVRLTARFVNVETSEVTAAAKVDGTTRELLRLQDRITAALLRSAGYPVRAKQVEADSQKRPDLASLKTLELYGQAVTTSNDEQKKQLLQAAVAEDQHFSYAVQDLAELESRLARYQQVAAPLQDQELSLLRTQARQSADVAQSGLLMVQLLGKLGGQYRYYELNREARRYLAEVPVDALINPYVGSVALMLIQSDSSLKDYDALLRDGEWFLKRAPGSSLFTAIQTLMQQAIERKRTMEEGRQRVEQELAGANANKDDESHWDLCLLGDLCRNHEQYGAALRFYEACEQLGRKPAIEVLPLEALSISNGGLWGSLPAVLSRWGSVDARAAQQWRTQNRGWIPEDIPIDIKTAARASARPAGPPPASPSRDRQGLLLQIFQGQEVESSLLAYSQLLTQHDRALSAAKQETAQRQQRQTELQAYTKSLDYLASHYCRFAVDPRAPRSDHYLSADWGKVQKKTAIALPTEKQEHILSDTTTATVYEIAGLRERYFVYVDIDDELHAAVSDLVFLCAHEQRVRKDLPAPWDTVKFTSAKYSGRIAEPPRIAEKAPWNPVHIVDQDLRDAIMYRRWNPPPQRYVLALLKVGKPLGNGRYTMYSHYWQDELLLDVPATLPRRELLAPEEFVWVIMGSPRFDSETKKLVLVAADLELRYLKQP